MSGSPRWTSGTPWLPCSSPHQSWIPASPCPLPMQLPQEGVNLKEMLADLEVELIRQALESQDGVVARAADLLSMRRTTLVEKMKKYGMSKGQLRSMLDALTQYIDK